MTAWIDAGCYMAGAALLLLALVSCRKRGLLGSRRQRHTALAQSGSFCILFLTGSRIHPAPLTLLALVAMTVGGILAAAGTLPGSEALEKYRSRGPRLGILAVSAYGSLASFFQRFFLAENARIPLSWEGVFYCLVGTVWFTGIVWLGLYLLEAGKARFGRDRQPSGGCRKRAFLIIWAVLTICQTVILAAHWPGAVTMDTTSQLRQIVSGAYDDWHNVMHTLLLQLILTAVPDVGAAAAVQMLLFSLLLTAVLMLGYDRGLSVPVLCLAGCTVQLLPNQAMSLSNVLKDIPFAMAMLWAAYLLALLALEKPWTKKWSYWLAVALDLLLLAGLRHNGFLPAGAMVCLFLYLTVRRFPLVRLRALAASALFLLGFWFYKGPVFAALQVTPNGQPAFTPLLCAAGGYLNKGLTLSEEAEDILERVMPLEDWGEYYDRYVGHDPYHWERPEGSRPYEPGNITMTEAFRVYFEVLFKAPDVAVHDRLSGTDILWNVRQAEQGFNVRTFDFVYEVEETDAFLQTEQLRDAGGGIFYQDSFLARAYRAVMDLTTENSMLDMLLWRTGAWLIGLGILLVFWRCNRMGAMGWISLPLAANVLASLLSLFHQSFRYVYFIQLSVLFLIFFTVTQGDRLREN